MAQARESRARLSTSAPSMGSGAAGGGYGPMPRKTNGNSMPASRAEARGTGSRWTIQSKGPLT